MNGTQFLASQPWVERLGWTLLHFLWQGIVIAALHAVAPRWLARASGPNTRYVLACAALAAMMAAPVFTWSLMRPSDPALVSTHFADRVPFAASTTAAPVILADTVFRARSAQFLPWVVAAWLAGAIVFWIRLMAGCIVAARVRSKQVRPAPPEWQQTLNRLKARLGVARPVRLLISALVQTPAVVGWLKPVVLVPIGALAGLPSEQVEALLIHELAHIRRNDYLVNILQSVAEALLFYHPAVWWVSGYIRAEREMCCDNVAVSLTGDVFAYASALAELEASRPAHLHAAIAANGGSLTERIGRLLGQSRPVSRTLPGPGVIVSAVLLVATAYAVSGQSTDSPRFDVASIKLDTSAPPRHIVRPLPGGLHAENASVRMLMQNAFALQSFQISGGPEWVNSDGYNIEAKAQGSVNRNQVFLMLRSLLDDRFKLKAHRETKELPVYALTAAKSGLKLEPPKEGGCVTPDPNAPGPPPSVPCGRVIITIDKTGLGMHGSKVPIAELTGTLSTVMGSAVIDKTGFTGEFDFRLDFAADQSVAGLTGPLGPAVSGAESPDPAGPPSIFNALQEQLGLRLESTKGPVRS